MDYEMSYYLNLVSLMVAAILAIVSRLSGSFWFGAAAVIVAVLGFLQLAVYFRCPHCHKHLILRGGLPEECPKCGKNLRK